MLVHFNRILTFWLLAAALPGLIQADARYRVTTLAGTWAVHGDNGVATSAQLNPPRGVACDSAGNLYIADSYNHRIRRVSPSGIITTFAGTGEPGFSGDGGPAVSARLNLPCRIAISPGGEVYFSDMWNQRIRAIGLDGVIRTVAGTGAAAYGGDGGPAKAAPLNYPEGLGFDAAGNLYIADGSNNRIRRIDVGGVITTIAGTGEAGFSGDGGKATSARIDSPTDVVAQTGGILYIADDWNNRVRKVDASGVITTVAGDGTSSNLNGINSLAIDPSGRPHLAEAVSNGRIIRLEAGASRTVVAGGVSTGPPGDGGPAVSAHLDGPHGICFDAEGNLYISESYSHLVRKIGADGKISTVAGTPAPVGDGGVAASAKLLMPEGLAMAPDGSLLIADWMNSTVRRVQTDGTIRTVAGTGLRGWSGDGGAAASATLSNPAKVAADAAGNIYIADDNNNRIRKVTPAGTITTFAGISNSEWGAQGFEGDGGPATKAKLYLPSGVAVDAAGDVYIADTYNHRIRKVGANSVISTVVGTGQRGYAGDGATALSAQISAPRGVAFDAAGNLLIADTGNNRIRKVTASGIITTIAGTGTAGFAGDTGPATSARLNYPAAVCADNQGNVYIADNSNNRIRRVSADGAITTIAGTGAPGYGAAGGWADQTPLRWPYGVAADASGNVYVADSYNQRVLKLEPTTDAPVSLSSTRFDLALASGSAAATQVVDLNAAGATPVSFTAASSATWLTVSPASGETPARLRVGVDPSALSPGAYTGTITVSAAGSISQLTVRLTVVAAGQTTPLVSQVVNAASFAPGVSPGSWFSVMGANLSATPARVWRGDEIVDGKLPAALDGVRVTVGGQPAYIHYISPVQINAQAPDGLADGDVTVRVEVNGAASNAFTTIASTVSPALFLFGSTTQVAARHADFKLLAPAAMFSGCQDTLQCPASEAAPGETVLLYGTGLGPTAPATAAGRLITAANLLANPVRVRLAGTWVEALAALSSPGLYQINVKVPDLPDGEAAVAVEVGGKLSQLGATLAIKRP